MDTKTLLPKYPDLLERFNRVDVLIIHELSLLGMSEPDAQRIIGATLGPFAAGVQVRENDGDGHDFVENAKRGSALAYALAWLLLSGGAPGGLMDRPPVQGATHPLRGKTQDETLQACARRFDVAAETMTMMLANTDFFLLMIGGAVWCGGSAVGVQPHCPACARNVIRLTDAQRIAGAAVLLAWSMYHETLDLIGREIVVRELAAKNKPPAASSGMVWHS